MTPIYWTKERIIEESKKYTSKTEFRKKSLPAYSAACRLGIFNELVWLKNTYHQKWTQAEVIEIAYNYDTLYDFSTKDTKAYVAAMKYGWLKDFDWLKRNVRKKYKKKEDKYDN